MKKFIDDFPIIAIKGFIGCLGIMGIFELADVDILGTKTIYTHGFEIIGSLFLVGYILHRYIWK
jgi:hypothetical protein